MSPARPSSGPPARLLSARVAQVRTLTSRVREFVLERPDGAALPPWEAGAHIELHLDTDGGPLIRRYSLVGGLDAASAGRRHYRIAVQRESQGRGSGHLHERVDVGTVLRISHPRNEFRLDRRDARSLLLAGGIGVTPILCMAERLALGPSG